MDAAEGEEDLAATTEEGLEAEADMVAAEVDMAAAEADTVEDMVVAEVVTVAEAVADLPLAAEETLAAAEEWGEEAVDIEHGGALPLTCFIVADCEYVVAVYQEGLFFAECQDIQLQPSLHIHCSL